MRTIAHDCARDAESALKTPFESPHLDFPQIMRGQEAFVCRWLHGNSPLIHILTDLLDLRWRGELKARCVHADHARPCHRSLEVHQLTYHSYLQIFLIGYPHPCPKTSQQIHARVAKLTQSNSSWGRKTRFYWTMSPSLTRTCHSQERCLRRKIRL